MGKKWAPPYADSFLAVWESEILDLVPLKPSIYLRFLDDIFIVWQHSLDDFNQFLQILNSHKETIKLKATIDSESIDFLDVTIFKGPRFQQENILDTKVFFKPTDTHELLHKLSYHPKHTFSGILKSQFLRFYRISNNFQDFLKSSKILIQALAKRNYSKTLLKKALRDTLHQLVPLDNTTNKACKNDKCTLCTNHLMITPYIKDTKFNHYQFDKTLTCQSSNIIYAITCTYCDLVYIGQTSNSLTTRFSHHKSTLKLNKDTQLNKHFQVLFHPDNNYSRFLKIVPLQHIPPHKDKTINTFNLLEAENKWITKLDTTRVGLNSNTKSSKPIPFVSTFSDQSRQVKDLVRHTYQKIRLAYPFTFRNPLLMSYRRNKNIKDYSVSTIEPSHPYSNRHTSGPLFLPIVDGPQDPQEVYNFWMTDYLS